MSLTKFDEGKPQWHLLPIKALIEVIKALMHGKKKYGAWNWAQGGDYSRIYDATLRHITAWWDGEDLDPESGLSHLAHAACGVLFLLELVCRDIPVDDRRDWND